jgi:transcriptional regulator with XRE-family HTH domain
VSVAAVIREDIKVAGKRMNQTDVAVGERIKAFRKDAKLSKTELANEIGVAFQQVQKYENGINRVSALVIELESMPAAPKFLKAFSEISDPLIQTEIIKLLRAASDR